MDKINELTKQQKADDNLLIAKVKDKIKFVEARNRFENTDFLDLSQQQELQELMAKEKVNNYEFFGGYDNSDRKILIIYPNNFTPSNSIHNQIMLVVRVTLPKELNGQYEHKTYLGALMKIGLKREKVGDILVRENGADIIIAKEIENFIITNINSLTRFQKAKIESLPVEDLEYIKPEKTIIKINVPSMRLDCIVGELAKCSRSEASKIIQDERVFINFKVELRGTRTIQENTIITIRGKGRFKLTQIIGQTKSGRINLEIEK